MSACIDLATTLVTALVAFKMDKQRQLDLSQRGPDRNDPRKTVTEGLNPASTNQSSLHYPGATVRIEPLQALSLEGGTPPDWAHNESVWIVPRSDNSSDSKLFRIPFLQGKCFHFTCNLPENHCISVCNICTNSLLN